MNITKNQWIAIGVVGAVAVWYFFLRKKDTESGYDNNLMLIGNENGYTNYQLDGGSLESGYGPDFGAYGSYGNESSYTLWAEANKKNGKCPYGYILVTSGPDKGWCRKDVGAIANPVPIGTGLFGKI